ncbi:MAG: energy transducer TonB [Gammaproteobacteria bacterium]
MQKASGFLLAGILLMGCTSQPTSVPPPKPAPAAPVLIGTPVSQVATPELQAIASGQTDQQMLVRFTVKADGSVQNPQAVFTKLSPVDTAAVLTALQQWRFKPAVDGTTSVDRDFIYPLFFGPDADQDRTRFFCRNEKAVYEPDTTCEIVTSGQWRIYRMNPIYPPALLSKRLAGSVTLSFDVGPHGQVLNPKVTSAPGLFDAAALDAVKQWYFEPLAGENRDAPAQHVTVTVKFTPPVVGHSPH